MTDHQVDDGAEPDAGGEATAPPVGEQPRQTDEAVPVAPDGADDGSDDRTDAAADAAANAPVGHEAEAADAATGGDADAEDADDAEENEAPPEGKDRLQALQEDIDEVRRRVADPLDDGGSAFIKEGEADKGQPVDDTIAPPG